MKPAELFLVENVLSVALCVWSFRNISNRFRGSASVNDICRDLTSDTAVMRRTFASVSLSEKRRTDSEAKQGREGRGREGRVKQHAKRQWLNLTEGDVRGRVPISSHSEVTVHLSPRWKSAGGSMSAEVAKPKAICIPISIPPRWGPGPSTAPAS